MIKIISKNTIKKHNHWFDSVHKCIPVKTTSNLSLTDVFLVYVCFKKVGQRHSLAPSACSSQSSKSVQFERSWHLWKTFHLATCNTSNACWWRTPKMKMPYFCGRKKSLSWGGWYTASYDSEMECVGAKEPTLNRNYRFFSVSGASGMRKKGQDWITIFNFSNFFRWSYQREATG